MRAHRIAVMLSIVLLFGATVMAQSVWEHYPGNPIMGPGNPGEWDANGRGATTVLFDGSVYHMWFQGYNANFGFSEIGHATSIDGISWGMDSNNPVVRRGAPGEWDDDDLWSAAVIYEGGQFQMWYSGWHNGYERGGYATSPDGSDWTKHPGNPVIDVGAPGSWDQMCVRPNTVIHEGGTYKMWYNGYLGGNVGRIGYAESPDGIIWTKHADNPVLGAGPPGAWDSLAVAWPSVVFDGTTYHMLFGGAMSTPSGLIGAIGCAFSADGIYWAKHPDNPVVTTPDGWAIVSAVLLDGPVFRMWYSHYDGSYLWIDYATSTCCAGIFGDTFESGDTSAWSATVP